MRIVRQFSLGAAIAGTLAWSVVVAAQAVASPLGPAKPPTNAYVYGLSCRSASSCEAVGSWTYQSEPTEGLPLAEVWNGSAWKVQATPSPGSSVSMLRGVACPSAKVCNAVGVYYTATGSFPFAEHWNGSRWLVDSLKIPAHAVGGSLNAIACPSSDRCMAAGYYENSSFHIQNLAEYWNGSSWSVQTPTGLSAAASLLQGIACPGAHSCFAVGQDENGLR